LILSEFFRSAETILLEAKPFHLTHPGRNFEIIPSVADERQYFQSAHCTHPTFLGFAGAEFAFNGEP
jgi:hypothetical protein